MITALAKLGIVQVSFGEISRIKQSFRIDCNLELSRIFKCKNYSVVFVDFPEILFIRFCLREEAVMRFICTVQIFGYS